MKPIVCYDIKARIFSVCTIGIPNSNTQLLPTHYRTLILRALVWVPKLIEMQQHLVMTEGRMSDGVKAMLKNIGERGQPWVGCSSDREAWFEDLDIKVLSRGDRAE